MTPRVSVIIVTWNARPLLEQCLPSVVATDYENLEIIVADNNSQDGSAAWVRERYGDRVKVVCHPENWAFCRGNNAAVPHATGEYIVLLNNDVEVEPNWLNPLIDLLDGRPDIAAAQPKLLQYDERSRFEYAGASGGFIDRFGYPFTRGRIFETMESDAGQYDDTRRVFWASGAALMLRRKAFEEVGLLDETFVLHMEEIDLCWRLAHAGYSVFAVPESKVYHVGGSSLPRENPQKTYYNFRNSLLMLYKNLSPSTWRRTLPARVALDLTAVLYMLVRGRWGEARAVVRAYRDAISLFEQYTGVRPAEDDGSVPPPYDGSIVTDYFLRGRRTFRELPSHRFLAPYRTPSASPPSERPRS